MNTEYKVEYQIWYENYNMKEEVDSADTLKEAKQLLRDYKIAFHYTCKLWIKKVLSPVEPPCVSKLYLKRHEQRQKE